MSGGLPSLYAAWMDDLLAAPIPDEKVATCDDCAMCRPDAVAPLSFSPELKCCTYIPELPNFLVGRILSDDDPSGAAGRATVMERIRTGVAVTLLGLGRPRSLERLYLDSGAELFGRSAELRCPHYEAESGRCGIWRHRNSTCTSWFCKHSRGAVGMRFWATVRDLLGAVEKNLSQWCLLEMESDPETLLRALPTRRPDQRQPEVPDEAAARRLAWGSWFGREDEYYVECARRLGEPTWASVMARSGPEVQIRARQVQHMYRKLTSKELPDALIVKGMQVFQLSEERCCVSAYSALDPLAMPVELLTSLQHFDGRPTTVALKAIRRIEGLRLTPQLVQKLVDFEILEPRNESNSMTQNLSLESDFWSKFAETYWNRKPTRIRPPFPTRLVTPAEVFRALVSAKRRLRVPTDDFAFFRDDRRVVMEADLDRCLPRAKDGSVERYLARLKRASAGEIAIYVNNFQAELGWGFFKRVRQFLKGLYEITGVPADLAEVDLFLGNYRRTPTGVHRDAAHVFCFIVEGRKRIRVWRADAIRSRSPRKGPTPYQDYLKDSVCLEGAPGDILYWPSTYWHVAESDGRPESSLSLGLYYGAPLIQAMAHNLREWACDIAGDDETIDLLPFSNGRVPSQVAAAAKRAWSDPMRLRRQLARYWMERITGYGFDQIPLSRSHVPLRTSRVVRADPTSPILFRKFNQDMVVSANGRSITVRYHNDVEKFMRTVTQGKVCAIATLLRTTTTGESQGPSRQAARKILRFLLDERALVYV